MPPQTQQRCSKTPLDFVGPGILRWDGDKSTQLTFNATTVSTGTFPKGSMWRKNPLPRSPTLWSREGPSFEPHVYHYVPLGVILRVPGATWVKEDTVVVVRC